MKLDRTIIFAQKLKQLRYSNNMTMNELGKQIGISKQALSKLESGQREPSLYTVVKIANYFNCSLDDLVFGGISIKDDTYLELKDFINDISDIEKTNLKLTEQIASLKKFAKDVDVMTDLHKK